MGYQDLPPDHTQGIEMEYFLEAIDYFSSLDQVMSGGIALIGLSFAGTLVLKLSTLSDKVCTVISMSANYYLTAPSPGLFYQGTRIPTPKFKESVEYRLDERGGYIERDFFDTSDAVEPYAIPIESSRATFLLITGQDDLNVEAETCMRKYVARMTHCGRQNKVSLLCFPKTGHFMDPPYGPQTFLYYNPIRKAVAAAGGELLEQAAACEHCWNSILKFLDENLPQNYVDINSKL